MKRILLFLLALGAVCSLNAKTQKCLYRVTVTGNRPECPVVIRDVPEWAQSAVVSIEGLHQIPSQLDRDLGELVFVYDISGSRDFRVVYSSSPDKRVFSARVHAQMWLKNPDKTLRAVDRASSEKNDMYHKLHHHGPAFESEYAAYRIYFDNKQTIDTYGKKRPQLELAETMWYPSDEQLSRGYGHDNLRVFGSGGRSKAGTPKREKWSTSPISNVAKPASWPTAPSARWSKCRLRGGATEGARSR